MKTLNKNSVTVFCSLVEKMNGKQYLKIANDPFMPLTIEIVGEGIITPFGTGLQYSLCHYYTQMGDLMKDPEMCFIMVDNRNGETRAYQKVKVIPCLFQQDNAGVFEESVILIHNRTAKYSPKLNAHHTEFANVWLANIKAQGFLR